MPADPDPEPEHAGKIFAGWYTGRTGGDPFTRVSLVEQNMTVYAQWDDRAPNEARVYFDGNGGTGHQPVHFSVEKGKELGTLPTDPTRDGGYTFDGWYTAHTDGDPVTESMTIDEDRVFYARWQLESVLVSFDGNGGTGHSPLSVPVAQGAKLGTLPSDPTCGDYEFLGWYTALSGGERANVSMTITGDTVLYARWSSYQTKWIEPGTFRMGSVNGEPGRPPYYDGDPFPEPPHEVTLTKGFRMGVYEVTQKLWQDVTGKGIVAQQGSHQMGDDDFGRGDDYPIYFVTWYEALEFCNRLSIKDGFSPVYSIKNSTDPVDWIPPDTTYWTDDTFPWDTLRIMPGADGYRLPTEAQWEYACRAGTTTAFNWGTNYIHTSQANYSGSDNTYDVNTPEVGPSLNRPTDVGSYAPNDWGLYDMHGNVREMCWDWRDHNLSWSSVTDPVWEEELNRNYLGTARGGSYQEKGYDVRSAARWNSEDGGSHFRGSPQAITGFRMIRIPAGDDGKGYGPVPRPRDD
jgi:uncharacterized repeat protein (TIGR02543 family)